MRNLHVNRQGGFTLLEVVFAVGILAIGIMGYTSLKISNRFSWVFAKNLTQAVQLTAGNLEGLLMAGYKDVGWMGVGSHSVTVEADGTHTVVNGVNDANLEPNVSAGDFDASTVTWTVREKCPSELTKLVTYRTEWSDGSSYMTIPQVQVRP